MARRLPPRYKSGPKKGQFKPRSARRRSSPRKRRNPGRTVRASSSRKTPTRTRTRVRTTRPRTRTVAARKRPRRRARRRNPMRRPFKQLQEGAVGAFQILVGEAGARSLPNMVGLNQAGPTGLAIQALAALVLGGIADRVAGAGAGKMVLAGGLSAPIKTLVVSYNVPFLAPALSPAAVQNGVSGYQMGRYPRVAGVGRYPVVSEPMEGYQAAGMGAYYAHPEENQYYYES